MYAPCAGAPPVAPAPVAPLAGSCSAADGGRCHAGTADYHRAGVGGHGLVGAGCDRAVCHRRGTAPRCDEPDLHLGAMAGFSCVIAAILLTPGLVWIDDVQSQWESIVAGRLLGQVVWRGE